jgi:hypothetical protein
VPGDRIIKKSRYIPKRLLSSIEKLEAEKVPAGSSIVELERLGVRGG